MAEEPPHRKVNMSPDAKIFQELWLAAEKELEELEAVSIENLTASQLLNALLRRLKYDGQDINSLTVGEIRRAL